MVMTDGVHLIAEQRVELHEFAARIGLRRAWFQDGRHPHYDLMGRSALARAVASGAVVVGTRVLARAAGFGPLNRTDLPEVL